jgi:hypothetical protein
MTQRRSLHAMLVASGLILLALCIRPAGAGKAVDPTPKDIGGVVNGSKGPEAGVWVIAETTDLPTKFRKIVVTDDQGRFLIPDLPKASYKVWVRGYGLVDSKPVESAPGKTLALNAAPAPSAKAAAQIYPSNYWYSLLKVPAKSEFPMGKSGQTVRQAAATGGGDAETVVNHGLASQAAWINAMKSGCLGCHQIGDKATREIEPELGKFDSSTAAWDRRVKSGQAGPFMSSAMSQLGGRTRGLAMYSDWTDRIAAGEIPQETPPRPQGVERNLVLTEWDWSGPTDWTHDEISTDRRTPTINAGGPIYASAIGSGSIAKLDPKTNVASMMDVPLHGDTSKMTAFLSANDGFEDSPYWGSKLVWNDLANLHNPMIDQKGRLWVASAIRADHDEPAFCKQGSDNPYAKMLPLSESGRQVRYYDFQQEKWTEINTCFTTHHVQFGFDKDNTVYFSGSESLVGWIDTKVLDETGDQEKAQGWCPAYIDANGDGKFDRATDKLVPGAAYGIIVNPIDESIWYSVVGIPGVIVRIDRGSNPPSTCRSEVYEPPTGNLEPGKQGIAPRGIDVDRNGVIWTSLSASAHLASFDRRKCKVTSGPTATGQQCPEGWTLYQAPGPLLKGTDGVSADYFYYNWVDQFDTLGFGKNIPIAAGSSSDSLQVLDPKTGKWTTLRVPYPIGFYSRGMDGRIDDPNGGWQGRGVWATFATIPNWHIEGGKGTKPILVHFQMRPSPLAR